MNTFLFPSLSLLSLPPPPLSPSISVRLLWLIYCHTYFLSLLHSLLLSHYFSFFLLLFYFKMFLPQLYLLYKIHISLQYIKFCLPYNLLYFPRHLFLNVFAILHLPIYLSPIIFFFPLYLLQWRN